jgi:folate-binding protein YgfZ
MMTAPFVARVPRDLVTVTGPDATTFLQSLLSQDLDSVEVGATAHALLLQPQGKLLVELYALHRERDSWWCACEGGFGAVLADGLGRFKIRVKADIERIDVEALAVRGARPEVDEAGVAVFPVEWGGVPAIDIVGPAAEIDDLAGRLGFPVVDDDTYERVRIGAGVPRQGFDVDERTIAQEAGLERTAVSFTKGCFVGQELVCRIDTRGHVNRALRRLRADGSTALARGDDITTHGKSVGTVTSSAGDVGLAMLRREVEPGTRVDIGNTTATVEAL